MRFTPDRFDRLHVRLRSKPLLQRFTLLVRTLLAWGFAAPGITKLLGRDFAPGIGITDPMGAYFAAFHATGAYYAFVGLVQLVAAVLLLSRRTALPAACVYLPIIANIFVLVLSTGFGTGTTVMTGLMTLACCWLLMWDAHRVAPLVSGRMPAGPRAVEPPVWDALAPIPSSGGVRAGARVAYALAVVAGFSLTLFARGIVPGWTAPLLLLGMLGAGLVMACTWTIWVVRRRAARADVRGTPAG